MNKALENKLLISVPNEIFEISLRILNVLEDKFNIDIKKYVHKICSTKYIIYNGVLDIPKSYIKDVNIMDLILSYGLVKNKIDYKNRYIINLVCYIRKTSDINLMRITIIHELLHVLSTDYNIKNSNNGYIEIRQGFMSIFYKMDNNKLLSKIISEESSYLNEAYTQYLARLIYREIYKEEFNKNNDIYYIRAKCIEIQDIYMRQDIRMVPFKQYLNSDIDYYKYICKEEKKIKEKIDEIENLRSLNFISNNRYILKYKSLINNFIDDNNIKFSKTKLIEEIKKDILE